MKRLCILLLFLAIALLSAQVQDLPDMEISGESKVKIFLYKKALPYQRESTLADSLVDFFPLGRPELQSPAKPAQKLHPRHYLLLWGQSLPGAGADYRHYPSRGIFKSIGLNYLAEKTKKEYKYQEAGAFVDLDLGKIGKLRHQAQYLEADTEFGTKNQYTAGQMALYSQLWAMGSLELKNMRNQLRFYHFKQDSFISLEREKTLTWQHHSDLVFAGIQLEEALYLDGGKPAAKLAVHTPFLPFKSSSIGLIFSEDKLLPAFNLYHDYFVGQQRSFSLANKAYFRPDTYYENLHQIKYQSFPKRPSHQVIPLDFAAKYQMKNSQTRKYKAEKWSIENRSRLVYNDRKLVQHSQSGLLNAAYQDLFENRSAVELGLKLKDFNLAAEGAIILAYLPDEDWQRKAYQPAIEANMGLGYEKGTYKLELSLLQGYLAVDENGEKLPESIELSLGGSYALSNEATLFLNAENLLNKEQILHRALPQKGPNLRLGLKLLF